MEEVKPLFFLLPMLALAQSHPTWWTYSSPDATALVGIHWSTVSNSPFANAVLDELGGEGLGFPKMDCLLDAEQILISSPALLVVAFGSFPPAMVAEQAGRLDLTPASYRGSALWIDPRKGGMGVAQWSNQILLVGQRASLQDALDRARSSMPVEGESRESASAKAAQPRRYSPLLARAARFNGTADLWVVSARLPDALASRFVPFMVEARGFEGGVSLQAGLQVDAMLSAGSRIAAVAMEDQLRQSFAELPPVLRNVEIHGEEDRVALSLSATEEQLSASLRGSKEPVVVEAALVLPSGPVLPAVPPAAPAIAATFATVAPPLPPPPPPQLPEKPKGQRVIRIVGLDDGPVEIPYDRVK